MIAREFYRKFNVDGRAVLAGAIDRDGENHPKLWIVRLRGRYFQCEDPPDSYPQSKRPIGGCYPISPRKEFAQEEPNWRWLSHSADELDGGEKGRVVLCERKRADPGTGRP